MTQMRDRLPYPEHFNPLPTFEQFCAKHSVTDEEYEKLATLWLAMRLRRGGILAILAMGR